MKNDTHSLTKIVLRVIVGYNVINLDMLKIKHHKSNHT